MASEISDGVAVFRRAPDTGALEQLPGQAGCVTRHQSGLACDLGRALNSAHSVAVTLGSVYVASVRSGGVAFFSRNLSTGELTQLGCATVSGSGGYCAKARAVKRAESVAVSLDRRNVYVARADEGSAPPGCIGLACGSGSGGLAIFTRSGGSLTQLPGTPGCFTYSGSGGACTRLGFDPQPPVVVTPDGKNVYNSYLAFARDPATGALALISNWLPCPAPFACAPADALAVSPDGKNVYAAFGSDGSVLTYKRET